MQLGDLTNHIKHKLFISLLTALTRIINIEDPIIFRPLLRLRVHSTVVARILLFPVISMVLPLLVLSVVLDLLESVLQGLSQATS